MRFIPSTPQQLALDHLLSHDQAALFMGCGLGKTGVVLHAQVELMLRGLSKGALIVAPLRVCNLTWPAEVDKWDVSRGLGIHSLRSKQGLAAFDRNEEGLYVVNYDMLKSLSDRWERRRTFPFDTVVFDELTRAKNPRSANINALRPILSRACKRRWGLTGTPAPNGLLDLFAQIRLLDEGLRLGRSYTEFRRTWFAPTDYMEYNWEPKPMARASIYQRISGMALTLKSSDWLDIPDTIQEDVFAPLPKGEALDGYKELERELVLSLKDGTVTAANAAVLVNKLLQFTSGAIYGEEPGKWHPLHDAKTQALRDLVKQLKGEPLIVFYQYKHELERLREHTSELGLVAFSDATNKAQQEQLVADWNAGRIRTLAAHPKSMAHGLNMQEGGCTVAWLTPTWSREDYDQAIARVARRGQDRVTRVYRILSPGTVDDAVVEALRCKDEEQGALLNALRRMAS